MLDLADSRLLEAVLDSLDSGVYLVDRHRKIAYWNHGAERISGYLRQDVTGRFCRMKSWCTPTKTTVSFAATPVR